MGYLLTVDDVNDQGERSLWRVLRNPGARPVEPYLRAQLRGATQAALDAWQPRPPGLSAEAPGQPPPMQLKQDVIADLNQALVVATLWDAQRFAGIELTRQASRLLNTREQKTGAKLVQLNRLLLESAFPMQVRMHSGSMLTRWTRLKATLLQQNGVGSNPDLLATFTELFALFDQKLSPRAQAVQKAAEAVGDAADGSAAQRRAIEQWRDALQRLLAVVADYRQTLVTLTKGFNKKHPQSASTFTLLQQMLLQMHQEAQGILDRIAAV